MLGSMLFLYHAVFCLKRTRLGLCQLAAGCIGDEYLPTAVAIIRSSFFMIYVYWYRVDISKTLFASSESHSRESLPSSLLVCDP